MPAASDENDSFFFFAIQEKKKETGRGKTEYKNCEYKIMKTIIFVTVTLFA